MSHLSAGGLWRISIGTSSTCWQRAIEDDGLNDSVTPYEGAVERENEEAVELP